MVNLISPNSEKTNPSLYFLGPYNILIWDDEQPPEGRLVLPESLIAKSLQLRNGEPPKIGLITHDEWEKPLRAWEGNVVTSLCYNMSYRISILMNKDFVESFEKLLEDALELIEQGEKNKIAAISSAYENETHNHPLFQSDGNLFIYGLRPNFEYFMSDKIVSQVDRIKKNARIKNSELGSYITAKLISDVAGEVMRSQIFGPNDPKLIEYAIAYLEIASSLNSDSDVIRRNLVVTKAVVGEKQKNVKILVEAANNLEIFLTASNNESVEYHLGVVYKVMSNLKPTSRGLRSRGYYHLHQSIQKNEYVAHSNYTLALMLMDEARSNRFDPVLVKSAFEKFALATGTPKPNSAFLNEYSYALV